MFCKVSVKWFSKNRSLARFELKNIPPMNAGVARIKVIFTVDADGLLTVSASEETTKTEQKIEVKPSYGLSEEEIKEMLYSSMEHGREDMETRLLAETKLDADRLIIALNSALAEDADLLSKEELENLNKARETLEKSIKDNNREEIIANSKKLEELSAKFASSRMNKHIGSALRGTKIDNN